MAMFLGKVGANQVKAETLTGSRTITARELREVAVFAFDPDGAKDVVIPDAGEEWDGESFILENTAGGAEIITIKDTTGNTICTPTQNETATVYCRNSTWKGMVSASN